MIFTLIHLYSRSTGCSVFVIGHLFIFAGFGCQFPEARGQMTDEKLQVKAAYLSSVFCHLFADTYLPTRFDQLLIACLVDFSQRQKRGNHQRAVNNTQNAKQFQTADDGKKHD